MLATVGTAATALVATQIALGIATLVLVVPIPLAAAHQACAVLVDALMGGFLGWGAGGLWQVQVLNIGPCIDSPCSGKWLV